MSSYVCYLLDLFIYQWFTWPEIATINTAYIADFIFLYA